MTRIVPSPNRLALTLVAILLQLTLASRSARDAAGADKPPRFAGLRADGSRVAGQKLTTVAVDPKLPHPPDWQLDGQPLWEAAQPLRWLRDRTVALGATSPEAFVELVTGDRFPGTVAGYDDGRARPFDPAPPHLLVRPETSLAPPQPVADPVARILTRYVRRVVWQRRETASWQPGTVFFRDGRSTTFRAVRWGDQGVQLLLADGPRSVGFAELAELHLPVADFWDLYWEELSALCPNGEGRMWQFETSDGLIVTTSRQRSRLHHPGGPPESARWIQGLHPAWSLDTLWVPQSAVGAVRSFSSRETPLSRVALTAQRQQGWLTEQGPPVRVNRNVQQGLLRGGEGEFGWGFGVQALSRLEFDLPAAARVFRSRVGLDRTAGAGGCIRARVLIGGAAAPAFDSGFLVGSELTSDTGVVVLPQPVDQETRLILEIDAAHEGRPTGADPFDVRDLAAWFDPLVEFEPHSVVREVAARVPRHLAALQGWSFAGSGVPAEPPTWTNLWDELAASPGRFVLVATLQGPPTTIAREVKLEPLDRWLVVAAHLTSAVSPSPRLEVWIDGELAGEQPLAVRSTGQRDPPALVIPLRNYPSQTVKMEARLFPATAAATVAWRTARLSPQLPTLFQVLEDEATWRAGDDTARSPQWDANERVSGRRSVVLEANAVAELVLPAQVAIRETPGWGEYRYARFAIRKSGRGQMSLEFLPVEPREKPLRLDGGVGPAAFGEAVRFYQAELPDQWITMPVDLFAAFGRFEARALRLAAISGGPLHVDAIYLARTQADFELVPLAADPAEPTTKTREEVSKAIAARVGPSLVTFPSAAGKPAFGVLVSANGEVLATGTALGAPGRAVAVTLADGRTVMGRTKGVHRVADLGLLQLEGAGPWPIVEVLATPTLAPDLLHAHVAATMGGDGKWTPAVRPVPVRRTTRLAIWTDSDGSGDAGSGVPLVDAAGRLVGLASRRHADGTLHARAWEWTAAAARLRAGEVW